MTTLLRFLFAFLMLAVLAASRCLAEESRSTLAFPIFGELFSCTEHWAGQFTALGDALGTDCTIQRFVEKNGRNWLRTYKGTGVRNEDWFGWKQPVLSPCDGITKKVFLSKSTNEPGRPADSRASTIEIVCVDGVHYLLAHMNLARVSENASVKRGQSIADVGNNGFSRHPHIHIGAWKDDIPLQIRFDQREMGKLMSTRVEAK